MPVTQQNIEDAANALLNDNRLPFLYAKVDLALPNQNDVKTLVSGVRTHIGMPAFTEAINTARDNNKTLCCRIDNFVELAKLRVDSETYTVSEIDGNIASLQSLIDDLNTKKNSL